MKYSTLSRFGGTLGPQELAADIATHTEGTTKTVVITGGGDARRVLASKDGITFCNGVPRNGTVPSHIARRRLNQCPSRGGSARPGDGSRPNAGDLLSGQQPHTLLVRPLVDRVDQGYAGADAAIHSLFRTCRFWLADAAARGRDRRSRHQRLSLSRRDLPVGHPGGRAWPDGSRPFARNEPVLGGTRRGAAAGRAYDGAALRQLRGPTA